MVWNFQPYVRVRVLAGSEFELITLDPQEKSLAVCELKLEYGLIAR